MFNAKNIKPMLLKEIDKPFNDKDYLYELKYDGIRAIIYASNNNIKIISRNGKDITALFPELQIIKEIVSNNKVIFDGEIITFFNNSPSFLKLQSRLFLKNKSKIKKSMETIPVAFIAFDVLYENKNLMNEPLIKRKEILDNYKDNAYFIKTKTYTNGIKLFQKVQKLGLEGIVAKDKNSIYLPGKRVDYWVKIKNFKQEKFYIHGFIIEKEKISLLLGEYHNKDLFYVGKVSITKEHELVKKILKEKKIKSKFINKYPVGNYIKPKYQILVSYMERTLDNKLRQPFIAKKKA